MFAHRQATFPSRLTSLRYLVLRDSRRPLHFLHLGKTGGTAVKHALLDYREISEYRLLLHGHDVLLSDLRRGEKVMFVVRDPLTRFVSAFNGRLHEDRPRYHYPWREDERIAFAVFKTPDQLASSLSADDPAERIRAERAMRAIGHLNTSYWHWFGDEETFLSRRADLFFIGRQEHLSEDFELLRLKLDLPEAARLPTDPVLAHRAPPGSARQLSDVARGNLQRWYARDFAFVELCRELAPIVNVSE